MQKPTLEVTSTEEISQAARTTRPGPWSARDGASCDLKTDGLLMLLAASALLAGSSCQPALLAGSSYQPMLRCGSVRCSLKLPDGPSEALSPLELVTACMRANQRNDAAKEVIKRGADWGRRYNWQFFNDVVRANWGGDPDEFCRQERNQPKGLANCEEFNIEEPNVIAGTPTRGALCTMIVKVKCRDAIPMPSRRFLWTLQQERRPPLAGCWLIREVLAVDRAIDLTV